MLCCDLVLLCLVYWLNCMMLCLLICCLVWIGIFVFLVVMVVGIWLLDDMCCVNLFSSIDGLVDCI